MNHSNNTLKGLIQSSTIWGPLVALGLFVAALTLLK